MNDSKRIWVWVGIVVVVIAAVVFIFWRPSSKPSAPAGPVSVTAPTGQLVQQFPKNLILDSKASVSGSYSINYSTSTNQYTANYTSSSTVSSLYGEYQAYFSANNWTVTNSLATHPTFAMVVAIQNNNQVQVVISKNVNVSQVTVTYLVK